MELIIRKGGAAPFISTAITEASIDPVSTSGVDWWKHEVRTASVSLVETPALHALIEGTQRDVRLGFHALAFYLYDASPGRLVFCGVLPDNARSVRYYSLHQRICELELIGYVMLDCTSLRIFQPAVDAAISALQIPEFSQFLYMTQIYPFLHHTML